MTEQQYQLQCNNHYNRNDNSKNAKNNDNDNTRKLIATAIDPNIIANNSSNSSALQFECRYLHHPSSSVSSDHNDTKRAFIIIRDRSNSVATAICELTSITPPSSLAQEKQKESVAVSTENESSSFRSFFINDQYVLSDGTLYTVTPMDPLFWLLNDSVLPSCTTTTTSTTTEITPEKTNYSNDSNHHQWQPLHQILQSFQLDDTIIECTRHSKQQIQNIFASMDLRQSSSNEDNDDDIYYKFSVDKALQWLQYKQNSVYQILLQQQNARQRQQQHTIDATKSSSLLIQQANDNTDSNNKTTTPTSYQNGSFSKGFTIPNDIVTEMAKNTDKSNSTGTTTTTDGNNRNCNEVLSNDDNDLLGTTCHKNDDPNNGSKEKQEQEKQQQQETKHRQCYEESIQLVCNYLTASWRTVFLEHIQCTNPDDVLLSENDRRCRKKKRSIAENDVGDNRIPTAITNNNTPCSTATTGMPDIMPARRDFWESAVDSNHKKVKTSNNTNSSNPQSAGVKRLSKVNTSGMKKMNSFFTTAKAPTKNKN